MEHHIKNDGKRNVVFTEEEIKNIREEFKKNVKRFNKLEKNIKQLELECETLKDEFEYLNRMEDVSSKYIWNLSTALKDAVSEEEYKKVQKSYLKIKKEVFAYKGKKYRYDG